MSRHQLLIAVSERGSMCSHQTTHRVLEGQQDYSTVLALCPIFIAFDVYTENAIRDHLVWVSRVDRPGWATGHLPKVPQREMTPGRLLTTSVLIVTFGGNNILRIWMTWHIECQLQRCYSVLTDTSPIQKPLFVPHRCIDFLASP